MQLILQQDVAGYLSEGDLIDIITTPTNSKNNKKIVALSAIKILKIGEVTAAGAGNVNTNITLLLKPKQCLVMSGLSSFNITLERRQTILSSNLHNIRIKRRYNMKHYKILAMASMENEKKKQKNFWTMIALNIWELFYLTQRVLER